MRIWLATRAFFAILFQREVATAAQRLLTSEATNSSSEPAKATEAPAPKARRPAKTPPAPKRPAQSEAITLLSALQRDARFVDIVQESLGDYSDEQVGAAARDVLRDCQTVLMRFFELRPIVDQSEGESLEAPANYDTGRYRLTGNVTGDGPFRGQLVHHGWEAAKCELPKWSGNPASANIVAPVELEVQ